MGMEVAIRQAGHIDESPGARHCMHKDSRPDLSRKPIKQPGVVKLLFCKPIDVNRVHIVAY